MSGVNITVRVPLSVRRQPGRKTVVTPAGDASNVIRTRADPTLLKALARAYRWQRLLDDGRFASISELAAAEKIERGFLGKMLRLTLLSPKLLEAIMNGQQPGGVSVAALQAMPGLWFEQPSLA